MLGRKLEVRIVKEQPKAAPEPATNDIPIPAQVTYVIDHAAEKLIVGIAIIIGLNTLSKILINRLS